MDIFSKKNSMIALASILVIAMGFMAVVLFRKHPVPKSVFRSDVNKIETQSTSDSIDSIEEDLNDTDLDNIDKELQDIEKELDQSL
jgi:hypothetical protein